MIIDTHTHIFSEETYNEYFAKAEGKVSKVITISFALMPQQERKMQNYALDDLLKFAVTKNDLYVVAAVNVEKGIPKQLAEIERLIQDKKVWAIKLVPGYQHFYPSDEKIYPVAALAEKYSKPLIFHAGDAYDPEGRALLKYSHPLPIDELAIKFPKCKIVIAHFGFPYLMETAAIVNKNKNVYTDISGTIFESSSEGAAKQLVDQYVKDLQCVFTYFPDVKKKTMFGTDFEGGPSPLNQVRPYIDLTEVVFSKDEQERVFSGLAEELFFRA